MDSGTILDEIDKKILQVIQADDKISFTTLAEQLSVPRSTVHYRVQKMRDGGIIDRFCAVVNPRQIGLATVAVVGMQVDLGRIDLIAQELRAHPCVQLVATSTGDHNMIVQILARNQDDLWRFLNAKVRTIPGVQPQLHVSSFLDVYKWDLQVDTTLL